jgi:hypothetical protein
VRAFHWAFRELPEKMSRKVGVNFYGSERHLPKNHADWGTGREGVYAAGFCGGVSEVRPARALTANGETDFSREDAQEAQRNSENCTADGRGYFTEGRRRELLTRSWRLAKTAHAMGEPLFEPLFRTNGFYSHLLEFRSEARPELERNQQTA